MLIHPFAGWETKTWQPEAFAEVARHVTETMGWECLITWGPKERPIAARIQQMAPRSVMAPQTTLRQLAELVRRCSLILAGDTGILHLAAFMSKPTIGIYGSSDPIRNGPIGQYSSVVSLEIECQPCWKTVCPLGHRACLKTLRPAQVIEQIQEVVSLYMPMSDGHVTTAYSR